MQDDFIKIIKDKDDVIISQRIELAMLGNSRNAIVTSILNLKKEIDRASMLEIVESKEHQKPIVNDTVKIPMREYRRLQTLDKGFNDLLKNFISYKKRSKKQCQLNQKTKNFIQKIGKKSEKKF